MKLIKFSLPNCQPCKVLAEQMKTEGIESTEINILEDTEELGFKYSIRNVPVVLVLDEKEQEIGRARNIEQLKEILKLNNKNNG